MYHEPRHEKRRTGRPGPMPLLRTGRFAWPSMPPDSLCGPWVACSRRLDGRAYLGERRGSGRPPTRPTCEWRHGWQHFASLTRNLLFRDHVLLPSLPPLQAIPCDSRPKQCRPRFVAGFGFPLAPGRCGRASEPDAFRVYALACPRTGLLAMRAKLVERAWCKVAREVV